MLWLVTVVLKGKEGKLDGKKRKDSIKGKERNKKEMVGKEMIKVGEEK